MPTTETNLFDQLWSLDGGSIPAGSFHPDDVDEDDGIHVEASQWTTDPHDPVIWRGVYTSESDVSQQLMVWIVDRTHKQDDVPSDHVVYAVRFVREYGFTLALDAAVG